jgi:PST family polysaccharide transporter
MSLAVKATRGAAWLFAGGIASQAVGVIGTLVMLRFVTPDDYGAVIGAVVVLGTAAQITSLGMGQYVIVKTRGRPDLTFHATFFQVLLAATAIAITLLLRRPISAWMQAPGLVRYLPWMAISVMIDRTMAVPERTLMRDMRFKQFALARAAGEFTYVGVSFALVVVHLGGMALIIGNIARSALRAAALLRLVDRKEWLGFCRISWKKTWEMFSFGVPVSIGSLAAYAARRWDNLIITHFFGPAVLAPYNLAYSLAEVAGTLVGEQIVDVLLPSFTRVEEKGRSRALSRAMGLMSLVTSPLEIGLGAVSITLVATILDPRWTMVGPMLAVLSIMAIGKSPSSITGAFLQAVDRSRLVMWLEVLNAVATLAGVAIGAQFGPLWMCAGAGLGSCVRAVVGMFAVRVVTKTGVWGFFAGQLLPVLASIPMVCAVLATRWVLHRAGIDVRGVNLALEIVAGGVAYVIAAFTIANGPSHDFLQLFKSSLLPRFRRKSASS